MRSAGGSALLILYGCRRLRVWRQSSLSSSSNASTLDLRLIVENHVQQGAVDFDAAVVVNKAQFPKFVHEKTYARSRRADHLRQCLLADFRDDRLRPAFLAKIRQQQKKP